MDIAFESFGAKNMKAVLLILTVLLIIGINGQIMAKPVELCNKLIEQGYQQYDLKIGK
jgi:hypothetical protein